MNGTLKVYSSLQSKMANKEINLNSDTIKLMLANSTYIPNQNTHQYLSDITGEISASETGYTQGGQTLTNITFVADGLSTTLKADNVVWNILDVPEVRYAILYDDTPNTAASKPLIGYIEYTPTTPSGQISENSYAIINSSFEINWSASGIITYSIQQ